MPRQTELGDLPVEIPEIMQGFWAYLYVVAEDKVIVDRQSRRVAAIVDGVIYGHRQRVHRRSKLNLPTGFFLGAVHGLVGVDRELHDITLNDADELLVKIMVWSS